MTTIHELPFSSADCDESPRVTFILGKLTVLFDYVSNSGQQFAELAFDRAFCLIFTPDFLVSEAMVDAYSKVCEYDNSDWLIQCREKSEPT